MVRSACPSRALGVIAAAVLLRVLLVAFFPSLPDLLTGRVGVSTPVSSFKRLQEGVFLYTRGLSPYVGGVFHQAPIFLPIFSLFPQSYSDHPLASGLIYIVLDVLNALALISIASSSASTVNRLYTTPRKSIKFDGSTVAAAYLFNPFTVANCLGRSTNSFTNTAIIYAIQCAVTDSYVNSMLALACASYFSLYPILLFPPLVLLCYDRKKTRQITNKKESDDTARTVKFSAQHLGVFAIGVLTLLVASYFISGCSWSFIPATYGAQLLVADLTPNVGLWWYFLIEIFDSFREFFIGAFWLQLVGYVCALTIRLRTQPLFVLTTSLGIFAIFKPYPSISDVSVYFAFLPLYRHVFRLMRYTFFAVSVLLYASLLGPVFHHLWIYAGSGNANFFYAITLVWSLGLIILVTDTTFAVLRDELEFEKPEMKGKNIKQV